MREAHSADGTRIAFETTGAGAPLILVGGAFCDRRARAAGTPLAALLRSERAVVSYDRRGRGDSGDTPPYAIDREVEDLAALIATVGGRASLYGNSSGALLALEAAAQGLPVDDLVLFEPPILLDPRRRPDPGFADQLDELCAEGRRSDAAERFLSRLVGVPAPVVAGMKRAPMWPGLEALAHTLSHEVRLVIAAPSLIERAALVHAPTRILVGGASEDWMQGGARVLAEAMPGGRYEILAGQTHDVDLATLADVLKASPQP